MAELEAIIRVKQILRDGGLGGSDLFEGAGESEISAIEAICRVRLPGVYRGFLAAMGHDAGPLLMGMDYALSELPPLQAYGKELIIQSDTQYQLPASAFVFMSDQGCSILFFDCNLGDDPPVYVFGEDDDEPEIVSASFSSWLVTCAEQDVEMYQARRARTGWFPALGRMWKRIRRGGLRAR